MTLLFLILAVMTLAGAVAAMTLRMLVHSVLALTIAFAGLAALYILLGAQFVGLAQILVYVGAVAILIVFAIFYTIISKITGLAPLGWSSIILSVYFMGSVQLLSIGILGEYVHRIYKETQNRPIFIVSQYLD